jgi:hypothetical protein
MNLSNRYVTSNLNNQWKLVRNVKLIGSIQVVGVKSSAVQNLICADHKFTLNPINSG